MFPNGIDTINNIVTSPYGEQHIPEESIWQQVRSVLEQRGNNNVLIEPETNVHMSCVELLEKVERLAAHLQSFGVKKGDLIGFYCPDSCNLAISVLAVLATGAIYVTFSPMFATKPDQMIQLGKLTNCTYFITSKNSLELIRSVDQTLHFKKIFILDGDSDGCLSIPKLLREKPKTVLVSSKFDVHNDPAVVLFTSGTTSLPKAVTHSHYTLLAASICMRSPGNWVHKPGDIILSFSSLTHSLGICVYLNAILSEAQIILVNIDRVSLFGEIVDKYKVTNFVGFTYRLWLILNDLEENSNKYDLSTIKHIQTCGQSCSGLLIERMYKMFWNAQSIRSAYGQTETATFMTFDYDNVHDLISIGRPACNVQIKIRDIQTGKALPANKPGEILIQTPSMFKYYMGKPDATEEATREGWLHTGDIGYYDEAGRIYITDRIRDLILCMDMQVAPADIENAVLKHPAVLEVAALGMPDDILTHAPAACVVLKSGFKPSAQLAKEIIALVSKLEEFKHLFGGVYFVKEIPKAYSGKPQKRILMDIVLEDKTLEHFK